MLLTFPISFYMVILINKILYRFVLSHNNINYCHLIVTRHRKSPQPRINAGIVGFTLLFKLANKILSLYFLVLVLWFYLVLYVFNCPKSIGCTEQCYQIVITSLLSIKDSRNILISVNYTINLYIFITNLVDNYIIFPYRIFIICPKADPFG